MEKVAESWLLSCPSNNIYAFGEECEVVVTLLYTTLTLPDSTSSLLPQELVFTFLERCKCSMLLIADVGVISCSSYTNFNFIQQFFMVPVTFHFTRSFSSPFISISFFFCDFSILRYFSQPFVFLHLLTSPNVHLDICYKAGE